MKINMLLVSIGGVGIHVQQYNGLAYLRFEVLFIFRSNNFSIFIVFGE